ncbi:hypothetical protein GEMRC1_002091 [Eukaryota sp. GEM-RC1]
MFNNVPQVLSVILEPDLIHQNQAQFAELLNIHSLAALSFPVNVNSHSFLIDSRSKLLRVMIEYFFKAKDSLTKPLLLHLFHLLSLILVDASMTIPTTSTALTILTNMFEPLSKIVCPIALGCEGKPMVIPDTEITGFKELVGVVSNSLALCVSKLVCIHEQFKLLKYYYGRVTELYSDDCDDVDPLKQAIPMSFTPGMGSELLLFIQSSSPFSFAVNDLNVGYFNPFTKWNEGILGLYKDSTPYIKTYLLRLIRVFSNCVRILTHPVSDSSFQANWFMGQITVLISKFIENFLQSLVVVYSELDSNSILFTNSDIDVFCNQLISVLKTLEPSLLLNSLLPILPSIVSLCLEHPVITTFIMELIDSHITAPIIIDRVMHILATSIPHQIQKFSTTTPSSISVETIPFLFVWRQFLQKLSHSSFWSLTINDCVSIYIGFGVSPSSIPPTPLESPHSQEACLLLPILVRYTPLVLCSIFEQIRACPVLIFKNCYETIHVCLLVVRLWLEGLRSSPTALDPGLFRHLEPLIEDSFSVLLEFWKCHPFSLPGFTALDAIISFSAVFKLSPIIFDYCLRACSHALLCPIPFQVNLVRSALLFLNHVVDACKPQKVESFFSRNPSVIGGLLNLVKNTRPEYVSVTRYCIKILGKISNIAKTLLRFPATLDLYPNFNDFVFYGSFDEKDYFIEYGSNSEFKLPFASTLSTNLQNSSHIVLTVASGVVFPPFVNFHNFLTVPSATVLLSCQKLCIFTLKKVLTGTPETPFHKTLFLYGFSSLLLFPLVSKSYSNLQSVDKNFKEQERVSEFDSNEMISQSNSIMATTFDSLEDSELMTSLVVDCFVHVINQQFTTTSINNTLFEIISKYSSQIPQHFWECLLKHFMRLSRSLNKFSSIAATVLLYILLTHASFEDDSLLNFSQAVVCCLSNTSGHFLFLKCWFSISELFTQLFEFFQRSCPSLDESTEVMEVLAQLFSVTKNLFKAEIQRFFNKMAKHFQIDLMALLPRISDKLYKLVLSYDLDDITTVSQCFGGLSTLITTHAVSHDSPEVKRLLAHASTLLKPSSSEPLPLGACSPLMIQVEKERLPAMARSSLLPATTAACMIMELACNVLDIVLTSSDFELQGQLLMMILTGILSSSDYLSVLTARIYRKLKHQLPQQLFRLIVNELQPLNVALNNTDWPHPSTGGYSSGKVSFFFCFDLQTGIRIGHCVKVITRTKIKCLSFAKVLHYLQGDPLMVFESLCQVIFQTEQAYSMSQVPIKFDGEVSHFLLLLAAFLANPSASFQSKIGPVFSKALLGPNHYGYFQILLKLLNLNIPEHSSFAPK